ncbi:hypothetical protein scyTo_0025769, partial [Scyliorhinus torazame]|nr:hypothetical protein [Scyliorhinus torazame]
MINKRVQFEADSTVADGGGRFLMAREKLEVVRVVLVPPCAFWLRSSFNNLFKTSSYGYIIAGGDKALITSQELPEDNPEAGINMLIK